MNVIDRRSALTAAIGTAAIGLAAAGWLTARHTYRNQLATARHAATHDPLTGIHNRSGLTETADRFITTAYAAGRPIVVALVDLVGFKNINDTHGHDAGDRILIVVAARLAGIAGPAGIPCRLGGDEFALLTTGPAPRRTDANVWLTGWLPHTHNRLTTPVTHQGRTLAVGATIGATLAHPDQPIDTWLTTADHAMYDARARRTTTAIHTGPAPTTNRTNQRRRDLARPTSHLTTITTRRAA